MPGDDAFDICETDACPFEFILRMQALKYYFLPSLGSSFSREKLNQSIYPSYAYDNPNLYDLAE